MPWIRTMGCESALISASPVAIWRPLACPRDELSHRSRGQSEPNSAAPFTLLPHASTRPEHGGRLSLRRLRVEDRTESPPAVRGHREVRRWSPQSVVPAGGGND